MTTVDIRRSEFGRRYELLTERQKQVIMSIQLLTAAKGYPPTLRELSECLGMRSKTGVNDHLVSLRKKGLVTWEKYKCRTLRIVKP